jgi:16S rRNA (cytidine1402-2'-O)-methyltransferase
MSKFYVVATPIGNLSDISLRALEVFKSIHTIICEDTRVTGKLLAHYNIKKPLLSYHQQSSKSASYKIVELLKAGNDLAYVSDAGTPGIQDPGGKLISEILSHFNDVPDDGTKVPKKIFIIPIPGPSAVIALLSVSGLPTDSFLFLGFLPKKGKQKIFKEITESQRTVVFYESGHRILKTLEELTGIIPEREIVVGRELTKKFETIYRGSVKDVLKQLEQSSTKGEFVVVIGRNQ